MKHKKSNNVILKYSFVFSKETRSALDDAFLYVLTLREFDFNLHKINEDCLSNAQDKIMDADEDFTIGEVRACCNTVKYVLANFPESFENLSYIEEDFPNLLHELHDELPLLETALESFKAAVINIRKSR